MGILAWRLVARGSTHTGQGTAGTQPLLARSTHTGATLTSASPAMATGPILLLSPAALRVRLPALCKTLEIPINCCY